jgi:putative hydrolase of the HAD superfamily
MSAGAAIDQVLVLDLDDTLYLEHTYVESGLRTVGAWIERQLGHQRLAPAMLDLFRSGVRGRIFDHALEQAGIVPEAHLIARMLQVYRQHRPDIALADDAVRLLERRPRNVAIAIITDGYLSAQRRKLRALNLQSRGVSLAICTDRWGRTFWKPSRRAFEHVQAFFGLDASVMTYVGDNPAKDFVAPRALGWNTTQIVRPKRLVPNPVCREPAGSEITSFDEFDFCGVTPTASVQRLRA